MLRRGGARRAGRPAVAALGALCSVATHLQPANVHAVSLHLVNSVYSMTATGGPAGMHHTTPSALLPTHCHLA